jgi:hypothetical protein
MAALTNFIHLGVGHAVVGLPTQRLLNENVRDNIQALLDFDDYAKGDFGRAANWADNIKSDLSYRWSLQLHFVEMGQEHTPDTCRDYTPDRCPNDACLVGALQNYTERVRCHQPTYTRREAIKFLLYLMGDIAQPLHSGGYARGGNDMKGTWQGQSVNVYKVWDDYIVNKTIVDQFNGNFDKYLDKMEQDIRFGRFAKWRENWLRCFLESKTFSMTKCAIEWVNVAHRFDCRYIFPAYDIAKENNTLEFSTDYYWENAERVDIFIARAITRSVYLLNTILGGCANYS